MQERLVELGEVARRRRGLFRLLAGLGVVVLLLSISVVVATAMPASASSGAKAPTLAKACGTKPVTMNAYFETGFPMPKPHQRVHRAIPERQVEDPRGPVRRDHAERPARPARTNPPDLMRLPQVCGLVKDNLLKNLDGYAKAFGWDKWPGLATSQSDAHRPADARAARVRCTRWGLNYSLTGVFYNKKLAAQIGMTTPPTTLAELDALLAKAKAGGHHSDRAVQRRRHGRPCLPAAEPDGRLRRTGSDQRLDLPEARRHDRHARRTSGRREHLEKWIKAGYFHEDVNAIDYATMMSRFIDGEGLFMFNGDWESGNLDKQMPGNVGFFLMPPAQRAASTPRCRRRSPSGSRAKAKHADCAAFFLNWVATNPKAREIAVEVGGSHPVGPADLPMPRCRAGHRHGADARGRREDRARTTARWTSSPTPPARSTPRAGRPQLQKLVAGQQTPEGVLKSVQADYESQVEES